MIFIEENFEGKKKVRYEFTYLDYLYYCDRETWEKVVNGEYPTTDEEQDELCVKEETVEYVKEEYQQDIKTGDKKHDKIFKDVLQNKDEVAQFIKRLGEYEVKTEELEIYNSNYITEKFEYKNADIVYKVRDRELYFLIEHQTKVDYSMAYRIFNYCLEIIRSVVENKKINRITYKYPRIVPIVLYTGNQKWNSSNSFAELQEGQSKSEIDSIEVKYKLVDVNQYETEELIREKTMFANAMILEKCKNNEEVIKALSSIRENIKNNKQLKALKRIVIYLYENEDETTLKQIIKILEESESGEDMSTIAERIAKELADDKRAARAEGMMLGIKEGINQGILQTIKQMIKMNFEDVTIKQVTGTKKSEIEKIRKEMNKI